MTLRLGDYPRIDAAVSAEGTFGEAALALEEAAVSAIAVLSGEGKVVGFFSEDDLVAGLFPSYLRELRHTAFSRDDEERERAQSRRVRSEPVTEHMRKPVTVSIDSSVMHAAERFLHCEWGAIAVVDADGRFAGMLRQIDFILGIERDLAARE